MGIIRKPHPPLSGAASPNTAGSNAPSASSSSSSPGVRTRVNRKIFVASLCLLAGLTLLGASLGVEFIQSSSTPKEGRSPPPNVQVKIGGLPMDEFDKYVAEKQHLAEGALDHVGGGFSPARIRRVKTLFLSSQVARETIFINIAAFRDRLCMESVREIFSVAKNPERVFVGVVDQRVQGDQLSTPHEYYRHLPKLPPGTTPAPKNADPESRATPVRYIGCFKGDFCPADNIRSRVVWNTEARGPTFGRFVAGLLFQGETFYMMMDSHSRFLPHYDEFMILDVLRMRDSYVSDTSMLSAPAEGDGVSDARFSSEAGDSFASPLPQSTGNEYRGGVLSYYPSGFDLFSPPVDDRQQVMAMCKTAYVDSLSVLRNGAMWVPQPRRPLRQPNTAAGFLFSESSVQLQVPFDPYLDFVFDGEEILYTARLYTHGFDAYLPGRTYIFHHYNRKHAPRYWGVAKTPFGKIQPFTRQRVHYFLSTYEKNPNPKEEKDKPLATRKPDRLIMDKARATAAGLDVSEDKYGMGSVRSLDSFYMYSHINSSTWDVDQTGLCEPMSHLAKAFTNKFKE